jgi:phosphoglycerate dehydrogenase-like enzyme
MKVVFSWIVTPELQDHFHKNLDEVAELVFPVEKSTDHLKDLVKDAEILVGSVNVSEELLKSARKLKLLLFAFAGIDRFVELLNKFPDLLVANNRGNTAPTAQHAVALLLAVANRTSLFDHKMKLGLWQRYDDEAESLLLDGITAGILGMGSIGSQIARLLCGFPIKIIGSTRTGVKNPEFPEISMHSAAQLSGFLQRSNILIISVPRTAETENLIGENELRMLPEKAILINVARGAIVNEKALYEALRSGHLSGAGLDVWYNYKPDVKDGKSFPYTYPFHELDNVVMSPHRAGSPFNRLERYDDVIENIRRVAAGQDILNRVDLELGY